MTYQPPHIARTAQMLIQVQSDVNTPIDFTQAGSPAAVVADATEIGFAVVPERFQPEQHAGTLSGRRHHTGARMGRASLTLPMAGDPDTGTDKGAHAAMQAIGFIRRQVKRIAVGAFTGGAVFAEGALIGNGATPATAAKRGRVVYTDATTGDGGDVYYVPLVGDAFDDTDTLHDGTNSADVDASAAPIDAGAEFRLATEHGTGGSAVTPARVTCEHRTAGQRHTIASALGRGRITVNGGEPVLVQAEPEGALVLTADGAPRAGDRIPPASLPAVAVPDVVVSAQLALTAGIGGTPATPWSPVLQQCEIAIENTTAARRTIGGQEIAASGYAAASIGERAVTVTIEPELQPASFDAFAENLVGGLVALRCQIGTLTGENGLIAVTLGALQLDGDQSTGERDGNTTAPLTLRATGTDDDEITVVHIRNDGS